MISPFELDVLQAYTKTPKTLLNQIKDVISTKKKYNSTRKTKVNAVPKQLDKIISCIAEQANKKDSPDNIQYVLDNLFGRFAEKYNLYVSSTGV
jgi:hypothetical protein